MSSSRIMVGLPLEKPRSVSRGAWRKWRLPIRREPVLLQGKLVRPQVAAPSASVAPEETLPVPDLDIQPLPLLSTRHFLILSAIALASVLLVWGLVRSNHTSVALSYEISALTLEKLALQEINRQLKTELTGVGSLAQLEEAARDVLGLITPNQGQIVVIDP
jgi:cell division protein FtsL